MSACMYVCMYVYVCVSIHVYICMHNISGGKCLGENVLPKLGGGIVWRVIVRGGIVGGELSGGIVLHSISEPG